MYRTTSISIVTAISVLTPVVSSAQMFADPFDTPDPAWITDRYEPAAWAPGTSFMGDNRLKISVDSTTDSANRPGGQQGTFYNTQGRQRAVSLTPNWKLRGQVYVDASFLDGTSRRRTDLWARTGAIGTETGAVYGIFGVRQFDPADAYAGTNMNSKWRVFDADVAGGWVELADTVTTGWHNLEISGQGTKLEYRLNGALVYTDMTVNASLPNLTTAFVQAFNFSPTGGNSNDAYSVYWDNVEAVPEPATLVALGAGALALIRRRRKA